MSIQSASQAHADAVANAAAIESAQNNANMENEMNRHISAAKDSGKQQYVHEFTDVNADYSALITALQVAGYEASLLSITAEGRLQLFIGFSN